MPTLPPEPVLEACFLHDEKGLRRLLDESGSDAASSHDTAHGPIVALFGRKLHSSRDPEKEARRFVRNVDITRASLVVLMGYASGYVARAILRRTRAPVIVFEPSLDALRHGLCHGPVPPQVQIITAPDVLGEALYRRLGTGDQGRILKWMPSVRSSPEVYDLAMYHAGRAIERARCRDLTTHFRVDGWLDFYMRNLVRLGRSPGLAQLRGVLEGIPAVVCAAGPSLAKNVGQLTAYRDKVFILCVNTAAAALDRAGVKPHAIISVESLDVSMQLEHISWITEVPAFLELTGNPRLFELPFTQKIPISVDTSSCSQFTKKIDVGHGFSSGFCVANAAASLVQQLGCSTIILCGQDLAYDGERVYAEGTVFEDIRINVQGGVASHESIESKRAIEAASEGTLSAGVSQANTYQTDKAPAWGDPSQTVLSNRDFLHFRDWYIRAAPVLKEHNVELINATEGGVHLPGWEEIPLQEALNRHGGQREQSDQRTVGTRFQAWLRDKSPTPMADIAAAVRAERQCIVDLVSMSLQTRALVDDDPDGDIMADAHISERLVALTSAMSDKINAFPIVREALTVPITSLLDRQELNTLSLQATIEQHVTALDKRLAEVEAVLDAELKAHKVA